MTLKRYLLVTTALFSLVALIHLLRLVFHWDLVIAGWQAPFWPSWLVLAVLAGLIIVAIKLIREMA